MTKLILTAIILCALTPLGLRAATLPPQLNLNSTKSELPADSSKPDQTRVQSVDIAPPPPPSAESSIGERERFHPYLGELSASFGAFHESNWQSLIGLNYMFSSESHSHWEIGIHTVDDGTGEFMLGQKHFFHPQRALRSFISYGAGLRIFPDQNMAGWVNYENFQVQGGLGVEELVGRTNSALIAIEAGTGKKYTTVELSLGFGWGI